MLGEGPIKKGRVRAHKRGKRKKKEHNHLLFVLSATVTLSVVGIKPLPKRLTSQPLYGSDKEFWASKN